jgi:hypothetical protein
MIRRKEDKSKETEENPQPKQVPTAGSKLSQSGNSKTLGEELNKPPSMRPRAHTTGEQAKRGRPLGAKSKKVAPPIDHSLIAERTRARIKAYNEKHKLRPSTSPIPSHRKLPPKTKEVPSTSKSETPQIIVDTSEIDSDASNALTTAPQPPESRRSLFSSTAVDIEDSEIEKGPPLYDPQTSGLRIQPTESEGDLDAPSPSERGDPMEEMSQIEIEVTPGNSETEDNVFHEEIPTTDCSAPTSRSVSPTDFPINTRKAWHESEERKKLQAEVRRADDRLEKKLRNSWD